MEESKHIKYKILEAKFSKFFSIIVVMLTLTLIQLSHRLQNPFSISVPKYESMLKIIVETY